MNKLIEALKKCETQKSYENVRYTLIDDQLRDYIECELEENEKLKKAIEIMRNKKVDIHFLLMHKLEDYNFLVCNAYQLTQQEYELLKEVLGDE